MTPREAAAAAKSFTLCLRDDDFDRIYDAIQRLKAAGPASFPILTRAFEHHDPEVRGLAAVALGEFPAAVPLLRDILRQSLKNESASLVRAGAMQALTKVGPAAIEAIPELLAAARFNNNLGGLDAEWALEAIGPEVIPYLFDALTSGERMVQARAIDILSRLDSVQCDMLLRFLIPMLTEELLYVANLNVTSFVVGADGTALDTISHSDACNVFHAIIHALERMGEQAKPSVHVLVEALAHQDPMVRRLSLDVFASMGRAASGAMPNLIHMLHDPEWLVRDAAVRAISAISSDTTAVIRAMMEALSGDDLEVRRDAVAALGYKQPEAIHAVPYLHPMVDALKRQDHDQYYAYIRLLGTFTPENLESAVPAFVEMLDDPDDVVRRAVCEVLGAISIAAKDAIPKLFDALLDVDPSVSNAAARAYGRIGVVAVPTLLSWLKFSERVEEPLVEIGPAAIPALVVAFQFPQRDYRERLSRILGRIGPEAIPALVVALRDKDELVCEAVGESLRLIGAASISALMDIMRTDDDDDMRLKAEHVLREIDANAATSVIRLLRDEAKASAALKTRGSPKEVAIKVRASALKKELKLFYLVGYLHYRNGATSLSDASNSLAQTWERYPDLEIPSSVPTMTRYFTALTPMFKEYFGMRNLTLVEYVGEGHPVRFTREFESAWRWAYEYLIKEADVGPKWFGFSDVILAGKRGE
jgi:HEAT repeat protein